MPMRLSDIPKTPTRGIRLSDIPDDVAFPSINPEILDIAKRVVAGEKAPEKTIPSILFPSRKPDSWAKPPWTDQDLFPRRERDYIAEAGLPEIFKGIREMVSPTTPYTKEESNRMAGEIPKRLKLALTYYASLGGRLGPKGLREDLLRQAEELTGFGPALMPAAGETGTLAIEWGIIYPKLFKAAGMTQEAIGKIPRVARATETIKKIGGLNKLAEQFPRRYAQATNIIKAMEKGAGVGGILAGAETLGKDMEPGEVLRHVGKRAALVAGIAGTFQAASEVDTAVYTKRLRTALIKASNQRFTGYLSEVDKMPIGAAKSAAYKSLASLKQTELGSVDKIVSQAEAQLLGLKKGKLYQLGQEQVESPQKAAERLMKYGIEPGRPAPKGVVELERGLGKTEPFIKMPMSRAAEAIETSKVALEAARHPLRATERAVAKKAFAKVITPPVTTAEKLPPPLFKQEPIKVEPKEEPKRLADIPMIRAEIEALTDKELKEKYLSAKPTSPEWVAAFKEIKRRKIEKPPAVAPKPEAVEVRRDLQGQISRLETEIMQMTKPGEILAIQHAATEEGLTDEEYLGRLEQITEKLGPTITEAKPTEAPVRLEDVPMFGAEVPAEPKAKPAFRAEVPSAKTTREKFNEYWVEIGDRPESLEDAVLEYLADTDERFQALEDKLMAIEETDPAGKTQAHKNVIAQLDKMRADLEAQIRAEERPAFEAKPKERPTGIFGQPIFEPISGKQLTLGLGEIERAPGALREVDIKPELARFVGKAMSEPAPPSSPEDLYVDRLTKPEFRELFNNPDNPMPEIRTAWNESVLGRTFLPKAKAPEMGFKEAAVIETGMSDRQRNSYIRQIESKIIENPVYQSIIEGQRKKTEEIGVGYYYVPKKLRGEVENITGKPGQKGFNLALYKHFTFDPTEDATDWTTAVQEGLGRYKAGVDEAWGEMDISEFVLRVKDALEAKKRVGALSETAYEEALEQADPELQILEDIRYALKSGKPIQEINQNTLDWAKHYKLSREDVSDILIPELSDVQIRAEKEKARAEDEALEKLEAERLREKAFKSAAEQERLKQILAKQKVQETAKQARQRQIAKLRHDIHAIAAVKGLTKKTLSDLKLKHTGYRTLTGKVAAKKITVGQLENLLKAVQKARPKRVGYKQIITKKTEAKIQSLKDSLIAKTQMTEQHFKDILRREVEGKEPRYINAKRFITEQEAKSIIRRMHDQAEINKAVLPYQKSVEANKGANNIVTRIRRAASKHKRMPRITESTRYYFAQAQNVTGQPFYYLFNDLENTHFELNEERRKFFDSLAHEVPNLQTEIFSNEKALKRIEDYILSKSTLKDKPAYPSNITKNEVKIAKLFEGKFKEYQLDARLARFKNWYEAGRPETGIDAIPQHGQYRKEINKAVDIYESQGEDALIEYLKTQVWGVIHFGYDPIVNVLRPKVKLAKPSPMTIGKGRISVRTSIEYHPQETNIFQRSASYMRNMDLLAKMRPKLRAFVRLAEDNAESFDKPNIFLRSVEDYIQGLKGYNVHENYISKILSAFYAQAGRARLAISLRISLLNSIEAPAFNIDKSTLIDPRNISLNKVENEYFETYVNQLEPLLKEFMMATTKPVLEYVPLIRGPIRFLNDLALRLSPMAHFDKFSRHWTFWGRINQVKRATQTDNIEQIYRDSKLKDYSEAEQEMAISILAHEGKEAYARYVARTHVEKTHYLYSREQRSLFELNHARVWSNLITFSRSWVERIAKATGGLVNRGNSLDVRARNLKILISVLAGAWLLGEIYKMVMKTKRNPYDPRYIIDYELGGLAWGAFETVSNLWQGILRATVDEKAINLLPDLIVRVPDTLVPFYMYVIRAYESLTDKKYVDREFLRKLREIIDKDYKRRPEAYTLRRDTIEKFTRMIEGRSVDIRIEEEARHRPAFRTRKPVFETHKPVFKSQKPVFKEMVGQ